MTTPTWEPGLVQLPDRSLFPRTHRSLKVPQVHVVDFYVQRSTEEQDACAVENYMGENGLAAEEEYKWGHYNCGASDLSPSPQVPAPHLMIPRHSHSLLDVPRSPRVKASEP